MRAQHFNSIFFLFAFVFFTESKTFAQVPPSSLPEPAPAIAPPPTDGMLPPPTTEIPTPPSSPAEPPPVPQKTPSEADFTPIAPPEFNSENSFSFFSDSKTEVPAFTSSEECKKLATSIRSCTKASCQVIRLKNGFLTTSSYEVQGWVKNKCNYTYSHYPNGTPESQIRSFKCSLNKSQINQLSNLFKDTLNGEAFNAQSSECLSKDSANKNSIVGECMISLKDKKILDVEKLTHVWGHCK